MELEEHPRPLRRGEVPPADAGGAVGGGGVDEAGEGADVAPAVAGGGGVAVVAPAELADVQVRHAVARAEVGAAVARHDGGIAVAAETEGVRLCLADVATVSQI